LQSIKSKEFILDGTHGTVRGGLTLTTLHALYDEVPQSCGYLLSYSKTEAMYTEFLSCVQEATGNRMEPLCVHMDFERALGNAWSKVFPNAPVFRDHFHFNHALVHFCQAHGLKDYAQEFSQDGNVLWYASSKADFDMSLRVFMEKWSAKQPRLATYFRDVYLNSYPPEEWASFGRPSNALPGML
jgi:hypothetical protein